MANLFGNLTELATNLSEDIPTRAIFMKAVFVLFVLLFALSIPANAAADESENRFWLEALSNTKLPAGTWRGTSNDKTCGFAVSWVSQKDRLVLKIETLPPSPGVKSVSETYKVSSVDIELKELETFYEKELSQRTVIHRHYSTKEFPAVRIEIDSYAVSGKLRRLAVYDGVKSDAVPQYQCNFQRPQLTEKEKRILLKKLKAGKLPAGKWSGSNNCSFEVSWATRKARPILKITTFTDGTEVGPVTGTYEMSSDDNLSQEFQTYKKTGFEVQALSYSRSINEGLELNRFELQTTKSGELVDFYVYRGVDSEPSRQLWCHDLKKSP